MLKKLLFPVLSLGLTGLLLYLVFSQSTLDQWIGLLTRIRLELLVFFVGLYGIGFLLRTWRYQLLLKGAAPPLIPGFDRLVLVTAVRNMLVDFLPARAGSLSYLVILNRFFGVAFSACLTSFTYAALFDLLTLGPLLAVVLVIDTLKGTPAAPWLWGLGALITLGGILVLLFLEPLFRGFSRRVQDWTAVFQPKHHWMKRLVEELVEISGSFLTLRQARLFWPLLGLSLLMRTIKYALLYLLLFAVMEALLKSSPTLPFLKIMFGIMGAEVAASLPVSGIAGFGLYEGILGLALTSQGIPASQGVFISFAMHLLSQIFEYSLGSVALLIIGIGWWRSGGRIFNREVGLSDSTRAEAPDFPGSPTLRVNGQDLEPESARSAATGCRITSADPVTPEGELLKLQIARTAGIKTVLFICTGNAVRSQMAEALVNHFLKGRWTAFSAGFLPAGINPLVVQVLKEIGIDASRQPTKHLDLFNGCAFDLVLTLCSEADRMCTFYPAYGQRVHLPFTDPLTQSPFGFGWKGLFRKLRNDLRTQMIPFLEGS